ncbi:hypothetical protein E1264_23110 [Actinomadura sp. KC216]|uniref:hypothetical protein n=1 Tax=Actinomadura sp. KC216 TaxID=2530370 RepID=UPI00104B46C5|nr:hypothetical protein [Actinomadura sp. KC216]TDB84863.1 hypothetical protein E1264_23110 [Actinomadura sp. KC216]
MRRPLPLVWLCASALMSVQILYRLSIGDWSGCLALAAAVCLAGLVAESIRVAVLRARPPGRGLTAGGAVPESGESAVRSWLPLLGAVSITVTVLLCLVIT